MLVAMSRTKLSSLEASGVASAMGLVPRRDIYDLHVCGYGRVTSAA